VAAILGKPSQNPSPKGTRKINSKVTKSVTLVIKSDLSTIELLVYSKVMELEVFIGFYGLLFSVYIIFNIIEPKAKWVNYSQTN
jgi:hypothetical protein